MKQWLPERKVPAHARRLSAGDIDADSQTGIKQQHAFALEMIEESTRRLEIQCALLPVAHQTPPSCTIANIGRDGPRHRTSGARNRVRLLQPPPATRQEGHPATQQAAYAAHFIASRSIDSTHAAFFLAGRGCS